MSEDLVTDHAMKRQQQRGIPPIVIDLLIRLGARKHAGGGAWKVYFDKAARRRLHSYAGSLSRNLDEHLDVYAVVDPDDTLITVAHRLERVRRN